MVFLKREADDEGDKNKGNRKSSISTKRSRAAAIHNQSERVSFYFFIVVIKEEFYG